MDLLVLAVSGCDVMQSGFMTNDCHVLIHLAWRGCALCCTAFCGIAGLLGAPPRSCH